MSGPKKTFVLPMVNVTIKLDVGDEFVNPGTFIPSYPDENAPVDKTEKRNDFLVLHSDEDKDWVACCLLLQLEHSQNSQKGFKGRCTLVIEEWFYIMGVKKVRVLQ